MPRRPSGVRECAPRIEVVLRWADLHGLRGSTNRRTENALSALTSGIGTLIHRKVSEKPKLFEVGSSNLSGRARNAFPVITLPNAFWLFNRQTASGTPSISPGAPSLRSKGGNLRSVSTPSQPAIPAIPFHRGRIYFPAPCHTCPLPLAKLVRRIFLGAL
jgi:hypothetical protein